MLGRNVDSSFHSLRSFHLYFTYNRTGKCRHCQTKNISSALALFIEHSAANFNVNKLLIQVSPRAKVFACKRNTVKTSRKSTLKNSYQ